MKKSTRRKTNSVRAHHVASKIGLAVAFATLVPGLSAAVAQEAAEDDEARLATVTVTATKSEQSLQDVPLSVTAISADALQNAGVTNVESLQFSVPGLSVTTSAGSGFQTSLRIRGVGTSGTNIGFEGSVGIFVDGIFRPRAGTSLSDFPDVERIEVLKGAQSTLFGRNTTAGAVSIITKKPVLNEASASGRISVGNLDHFQIRGVANMPVIEDKAAFRIAVDHNRRDGFLENIVPGVDDINDRNRFNARAQFLYEPTSDVELRLIGNYYTADESCCGSTTFRNGAFVNLGNAGGLAPFGFTGPIAADESQFDDFLTARNRVTDENIDEWGLQADLSWDLGNGINWFTQASYSDFEMNAITDADQTGLDFIIQDPSIITQEQFTLESRLSGELPFAVSTNWILGGYYSDETLGQVLGTVFGNEAVIINTLLSGNAPGFPPFGLTNGDSILADLGQDAQVWSVFGYVDTDLTSQLNLSGGLRFTNEEKTGTGVFTTTNGPLFNLFTLEGASSFDDANADAEEVTGNIALKYEFTDDVSAYASYARGYKSGGVNLDVLGGQGGADAFSNLALVSAGFDPTSPLFTNGFVLDPTFPVETVDAYEIGLKTQLGNNAVLNVAGFHSTFENFQLLQFTGTSFNILAAPEVTTQGVEADLQYSPIDGLNINASYTYADATYSAPFNLGGTQLDGLTINNAPEHSGAINATYNFAIPDTGMNAFVNGGWFYSGEYVASAALEPDRTQDAYSRFTARAGITFSEDKYGLEVWCRNCTDEAVAQTIFSSPIFDDSLFAFVDPSREYGVTLSAKF